MNDWRDRADCRGWPTERFFPKGPPDPEVIALCAACPVRVDCILAAISSADSDEHGIRGGMTPPQRGVLRSLLRKGERARPQRQTPARAVQRPVGAHVEERRRPLPARQCAWCRLRFEPSELNQLHCSMACAEARRRALLRERRTA